MAILVFILGLILLVAGAAAGYASIDLLPTSDGVLYALGAAVAVSASIIVFALGGLIWRIDGLADAVKRQTELAAGNFASVAATEPVGEDVAALEADTEAAAPTDEEPVAAEDEAPINVNRAGHLPSLGAVDAPLETPDSPPSLVGRYSSGGANYLIFDDGSIEAEMSDGTFKFASMGEFKRYLADRRESGAPGQ
jgi:hypothetical protein